MTTTFAVSAPLTKNPASEYEVTGNAPVVDTRKSTIDLEHVGFIMDNLSNLYSDPAKAVIREYTANAIDSHNLAGNTDPVEITLPSSWGQSVIIQDHGIGMSREDLFRFGNYGGTDKRDNLNLVGNMGMGSKCGLALANSFMVTAIKDGEKNIATVGKGDDGITEVTINMSEPTDEPNGVSITVPTNSYTFSSVANRTLKYLPANTVTVDGEPNKDIRDGMVSLGDGIHVSKGDWIRKATAYHTITAVMGGWGYDFYLAEFDDDAAYNTQLLPAESVIDLPIGSIDLTPSREDIRFTERTKKVLTEATEELLSRCEKHIVDLANSAEDFGDIIELARTTAPSEVKSFITPAVNSEIIYHSPSDRLALFECSGSNSVKGGVTAEVIINAITRMEDESSIYLINNDKDYKIDSIPRKVVEYTSKVAPDEDRESVYLMLNQSYTVPAEATGDTLWDYINRVGVPVKASTLYAAVNEHNRSLRGSNYKAGPRLDAKISTYYLSADGKLSQAEKEVVFSSKYDFGNEQETIFVRNDKDISVSIDKVVALSKFYNSVAQEDDKANFVFIDAKDRKDRYLELRGIGYLTSYAELIQMFKDVIMAENVVYSLRKVFNIGYNTRSSIDSAVFDLTYVNQRAIPEDYQEDVEWLTGMFTNLQQLLGSQGSAVVNAIRSMSYNMGEGNYLLDLYSGLAGDNDQREEEATLRCSAKLVSVAGDMLDAGHTQAAYDTLKTAKDILSSIKEK